MFNLLTYLEDSLHIEYFGLQRLIARVLSDILTALDKADIAALTLLDLSAAFDTVDHATLLRRLQSKAKQRCVMGVL